MSDMSPTTTRILVWDAPTRIFHWSLAASFTGAYLTAESERWRDVHVMLGYTLLGLIAFRLVWGLIGTRYARFVSFAFGPRQVVEYVRSLLSPAPRHYVGHNPAGSWAIYVMLGLGALAGASGYAGYADIGGEWMEDLHEGLASAMLGIVVIHVLGVIVSSLIYRENLTRSMITGYKAGPASQGIRRAWWTVGAAVVGLAIAFWSGVVPAPGLAPTAQVAQVHR